MCPAGSYCISHLLKDVVSVGKQNSDYLIPCPFYPEGQTRSRALSNCHLRVLRMLTLAVPEAALHCVAIIPADFLSCAYVPVDRLGFSDPQILLFHLGSAPFCLKIFPGIIGVIAEQDLSRC